MSEPLSKTPTDADIQLTLEEKEALRKYEARKIVVKPLIDTILPDKTIEQITEVFQMKYKIKFEEMDEEDRGAIKLQHQNENFHKQQLIEEIAQTDIKEADLAEYITTLYRFANTFVHNINELSSADMRGWLDICDTIQQAKLYQGLAKQWKTKFMMDVDETTTQERLEDFRNLLVNVTGCNRFPRPKPRNALVTVELFAAFEELYEEIYSVTGQRLKNNIDQLFKNGAEEVGLQFNDPGQTRLMLQLYKEVANYPDREIIKKFADAVSRYAKHHGLSAEKIRGLVDKLLPAMQNNDPQVEILLRGGNIWGMRTGDFGVGDYLCHAYASPVSSANLNELLLAARGVPATNLSLLEQNRTDALMVGMVRGLRDFIHDQRPHVHEVLTAMVYYYDTGDKTQLTQILPKADYFGSEEQIKAMFDKSGYERNFEDRNNPGVKIRSIDVLRRLAENTKPIPDAAPVSLDEQLNQRLQALEKELAGTNGVTKETLSSTVDHLNQQLTTMMVDESARIEPNHIMAISWVERRAFEVLQQMSYEDQVGAYKQEWFISLLKFQELIGSLKYDEQQFLSFIQTLANTDSSLEAYRLIGKRILENIRSLAINYKQKGRTDVGALWSGNVAHELVGLIDLKPARTEQGRKFRKENIRRTVELGYHPGD